MKYRPDSLMLELTRYCNMECPHCIRGDRQRRRMTKAIIWKALYQMGDYIGTIMFTGGEPALAIDLIEYTLETCKSLNIRVGNFWMATNGTVTSNRFFSVVREWLEYTCDGEMSGLRISLDKYHRGVDVLPFRDFEQELEYDGINCVFEYDGASADSTRLVGDGRALDNYACGVMVDHDIALYDGERIEGDVYISAKGDVISTCDISFNLMDDKDDRFNLGNILEEPLEVIYDRFFSENKNRVHD